MGLSNIQCYTVIATRSDGLLSDWSLWAEIAYIQEVFDKTIGVNRCGGLRTEEALLWKIRGNKDNCVCIRKEFDTTKGSINHI